MASNAPFPRATSFAIVGLLLLLAQPVAVVDEPVASASASNDERARDCRLLADTPTSGALALETGARDVGDVDASACETVRSLATVVEDVDDTVAIDEPRLD